MKINAQKFWKIEVDKYFFARRGVKFCQFRKDGKHNARRVMASGNESPINSIFGLQEPVMAGVRGGNANAVSFSNFLRN